MYTNWLSNIGLPQGGILSTLLGIITISFGLIKSKIFSNQYDMTSPRNYLAIRPTDNFCQMELNMEDTSVDLGVGYTYTYNVCPS